MSDACDNSLPCLAMHLVNMIDFRDRSACMLATLKHKKNVRVNQDWPCLLTTDEKTLYLHYFEVHQKKTNEKKKQTMLCYNFTLGKNKTRHIII